MSLSILVSIQSQRKKQPFAGKMPSNNVNAKVLSYLGRKFQVSRLMQTLSHDSRAFYVKQEGLKGFLVGYPPYFKNLSEKAR